MGINYCVAYVFVFIYSSVPFVYLVVHPLRAHDSETLGEISCSCELFEARALHESWSALYSMMVVCRKCFILNFFSVFCCCIYFVSTVNRVLAVGGVPVCRQCM